MTHELSYYDILKISAKATDEDVKRAYKTQAKIYHPDLNPQNRKLAELRLKLINAAYTELKTREKRQAYDRILRMQAQNDNIKTSSAPRSFLTQIGEWIWPARRPAHKEG